MNFKKKVNVARQKVMRGLTKNIGAAHVDPIPGAEKNAVIQRVLISRPNHRLGNLLLTTPLVEDVIETFPGCEIDLFVKGGLGPIVFKNYPSINTIIALPKKPMKELINYLKVWVTIKTRRYDLVINVIKNSSSGRLSIQFANARFKFFGDDDAGYHHANPDCDHMAKFPVCNFRAYISKLGFTARTNTIAPIDLRLTADEIATGKAVLRALVANDKPTICLYTFATGDKCYPASWWQEFYGRLSVHYTSYNIIEMLPIENVSQLSFKIATYYSKDIREMGGFIRSCAVWIGADSGIMHLASASLAPTVGLFSITNKALYQPYNHNGIGIDTTKGSIADWIADIDKVIGR